MLYRLLHPRNYLAGEDLQGKDVVLTIDGLSFEEIKTEKGTEKKWCVRFSELEARHVKDPSKPAQALVLNRTNAKTLAGLYGPETDGWKGKRVTLYFDPSVTAFGKRTGGIRIRDKAPPPKSGSAGAAEGGADAQA